MKSSLIKTILFVFVIIVIGYAVWMAYSDITKHMPKRRVESYGEQPQLKICLYKASWCHHCVSYLKSHVFDDTYDAVKGKYNDVVFVTYDFDENKKLAEKYSVSSFPTIIAVDGQGKLLNTFEGDRYNKDELMRFVEANRPRS